MRVLIGVSLATVLVVGVLIWTYNGLMAPPRRTISSDSDQVAVYQSVPFDLTHTDGIDLIDKMKFRLVQTALVTTRAEGWELTLQNMKFKNPQNEVRELCEEFPKIELIIQSADTIVNGVIPIKSLTQDCHAKTGADQLDAIKILKTFEGTNPDGLSEEWDLKEIRLHPNTEDVFIITAPEISRIRGEVISFKP